MYFQDAAVFQNVSYEYVSCTINTDNKGVNEKEKQSRGYLHKLGVQKFAMFQDPEFVKKKYIKPI